MKSSIVLAASSAVLSMGAAIDPRVLKTVLDITFVTVTVTEGIETPTPTPTPSTPAVFFEAPSSAPKVEKSPEPAPAPIFETITTQLSSSTPEPTPTPTPTPEPVVVAPVVSYAPAAEPVVETVQAAPTTVPAADDLAKTCVDTHNFHRYNHTAPALTWDSALASYALITAQTCVFEHDMTTGGGGYGQNLAMWGATGSESLGEAKAAQRAITEQWYNGELNLYPGYGQDSPDMSNFLAWGHFSQLVWVDSTTVGCGVHYCAAGTLSSIGSWYTVCNYKAQGNVIGSFAKNVLPPKNAAPLYVS